MNIIKFILANEDLSEACPAPVPASSKIPEWWKKQISYFKNDKSIINGLQMLTVKKCPAVFDSISIGYYILSPVDINIDATGDIVKIEIPAGIAHIARELISRHSNEQIENYPIDDSFHKNVIRIHPQWMVKTKSGFSCLFINPMNYSNNSITAIPGVIDTDSYISDGFLSFFVKKGFKGIISQGTPLVQVIPFKRENWIHSLITDGQNILKKQRLVIRSTYQNGYKNKFWSRKSFK